MTNEPVDTASKKRRRQAYHTTFFLFVSTGMTTLGTRAAFQLCPDCIIHIICSQFNSSVAEAMGVKFLAQENNSCKMF